MYRYVIAAAALLIVFSFEATPARSAKKTTYLGQLSANRYAPNSTSNKYGAYGNPYSSVSTRNPYGQYGSRYSATSANNPYASNAPKLYAHDGTYLGRLSTNRYDPESISNPYGVYGSRYSPVSVNNPYGAYGSRYSAFSATNPYTTTAPSIFSTED